MGGPLPGTAMFVVVYTPWERQKAARLKEAGLNVVVECSLGKNVTGRQIRKVLAEDGKWSI